MKALVYHGPGRRGWDSVPDPAIIDPSDIVARIDTSTICATDLHIARNTALGRAPRLSPAQPRNGFGRNRANTW